MIDKQRRNDNIFGISIIVITFMAGFFTNSAISTLQARSSNRSSIKSECPPGHLCFPLNDELQFVIDTDDYLSLIDNKITGIGYDNLMVRRLSLPLAADHQSSPSNEQLYLNFYINNRLVKTISPRH